MPHHSTEANSNKQIALYAIVVRFLCLCILMYTCRYSVAASARHHIELHEESIKEEEEDILSFERNLWRAFSKSFNWEAEKAEKVQSESFDKF